MKVVAITPDRYNYITPVEAFLNWPLVFESSHDWNVIKAHNPCAVIFLGDWLYEHEQIITHCKNENIPTVLMMDGTIEWKHFFENPKWSYGGKEAPYFPVNCDKICVPGESTYRFLDFFGNAGKCEVTGFPRFDHYKEIMNSKKESNRRKVLGIISGNTAGYTPEQIKQSKKLFEDIYHWSVTQTEIDVFWRLRKGFEKILDIDITNDTSPTLADFLKKTDAIISQPSTAAYEAMLLGIPTALADYDIAPNYMHSAWEIHSVDQIECVIGELLAPLPIKKYLQEQLLQDNLVYCGYSAQICADIINEMINISQVKQSDIVVYPSNMAIQAAQKINILHQNLQEPLFSTRVSYKFSELSILQEQYTRLLQKNLKLEYQLSRRTLGFWLDLFFKKLMK